MEKGGSPDNGMRTSAVDLPAYLIVNADDYGYFDCVNRGILAAARAGVVKATGILANSAGLEQQLDRLRSAPELDLGVHLSLTSGIPVSDAMRRRLAWFGGRFPNKELMSGALLSAAVTVADVREEWRRQIESCLTHGLRLMFINSHEHIHMWPSLYALVHELARDYSIDYIRRPQAEFRRGRAVGQVARNLAIKLLGWLNQKGCGNADIPCLGVGESGNLSFEYLQRMVTKLRRGSVHELMCHPGHFDPDEVKEHRLRRFHDWEGELELLTCEATKELFAHHGVRAIGYRDLPGSVGLSVDEDEIVR